MFEEYEKKRRKQLSMMRSVLDYGMGLIFILIGLFFFFRNRTHTSINDFLQPPNVLDKIFGVIFLIYGSWRVYRGYKKKYFR
jgi:threonine/homoserine/homoserine lactone efflux protein